MTEARRLVLVCNSHLDPVWLWPWEEGLAATLSTFRAAAGFCEDEDGFAFCHNEALLYRWVEEYEPALFARITALVRMGRWHVIGGWHLQPDCNLPCGESFVRQITAGLRFFRDRFGARPRVAFNVDPFGHTRGLVQVLAKSGYTGYLFCRPDARHLRLPADDFVWVGYDGSTVLAHRAAGHYNSERGRARAKAERWLAAHAQDDDGLLLWGVGNHGGGPSREDLRALAALAAATPGRAIVHGRPEDYFERLGNRAESLPRHESDLNPWAPGCYTSMSTVKRAHRRLESRLYAAEKMLAAAALQQLLPWPRAELADALDALLFCQFHDVLPGSSVAEVEDQALHRLGHGLDIVDRLRARAFFALLSGQPEAAEGEYPIFVHNPHPFAVSATIVVEFQPPEPNTDPARLLTPELALPSGVAVPMQVEKESCNIQADQRKRIVFHAELAPSRTTRYACRLRAAPRPPAAGLRPLTGLFRHRAEGCEIDIDASSGLLVGYRLHGASYVDGGAFRALVMRDSADPWGMKVRGFRDSLGEFVLMTPHAAAALAGIRAPDLDPVRIIEDGPVRTVVEAIFEHGRSLLRLRYMLPKRGTEVEVDARVLWAETDAMLKLAVPTAMRAMRVDGRVAFGVERHRREGEELVGQHWIACVAADGSRALTIVTDATSGLDFAGSELRLSCLRSPAYAGHPVDEVTPVVRQDRVETRVDRGEHVFRFWLRGGPAGERLAAIDREAAARLEAPMALVAFPAGGGRPAIPGVILADPAIEMPAMFISADGRRLIVRLFEPTGEPRDTTLRVPALEIAQPLRFGPFELKTLAIDLASRAICETDLLEDESRALA
jgi:alpha-mannosidase